MIIYSFRQFEKPFFKILQKYQEVKIENIHYLTLDSLVAQTVKNLPAMQKAQVQSVDGENAPENRMDIHSSILAWRIP